jgi:hypothetical protein
MPFRFLGHLLVKGVLLALITSTASLLYLPPTAMASYVPTQKAAILHPGQGVWYAPWQFVVYQQPDLNSPKLAEVLWGSSHTSLTDTLHNIPIQANQCMIAFYPEHQLGLLTVVGDAEPNWLEVIWDQKTGQTGWVQGSLQWQAGTLPTVGTYQTWTEFMLTHAKPAGFKWFVGVPDSIKQLHTQADDYAKVIPSFYLQKLKVLHFRGNWMLVQGLDLERNTPIGWMRWREENGELLVFPQLLDANNPWMQKHTPQNRPYTHSRLK